MEIGIATPHWIRSVFVDSESSSHSSINDARCAGAVELARIIHVGTHLAAVIIQYFLVASFADTFCNESFDFFSFPTIKTVFADRLAAQSQFAPIIDATFRICVRTSVGITAPSWNCSIFIESVTRHHFHSPFFYNRCFCAVMIACGSLRRGHLTAEIVEFLLEIAKRLDWRCCCRSRCSCRCGCRGCCCSSCRTGCRSS